MARKRPQRRKSSVRVEKQTYNIEEAFNRLDASELPPVAYANHVRMQANANEIIIDLYNVGPLPNKGEQIALRLVQRVAIPHKMGKGFATALANIIAFWEEATGETLPNERGVQETDRIIIWEEETKPEENTPA